MQYFRGAPHHRHQHGLKNIGQQYPKLKPLVDKLNAQMDQHHHHHHHRGWFRTLLAGTKRVFSFVLFPILIGIAFGVTASAVGMLVGQVVVFLWMKYRRTDGKATYERLETDDKEKLPIYEDAEGLEVQVSEKDEVTKD